MSGEVGSGVGDAEVPDSTFPMSEIPASMLSANVDAKCPECMVDLVDAGDERVCQRCGLVAQKVAWEDDLQTRSLGISLKVPLGSYMGTIGVTSKERSYVGINGTNAKYHYLKTISDRAGKENGPEESSKQLIERVGEKLNLPGFVIVQAISFSKSLLSKGKMIGVRLPMVPVSAYSLISACKVEGIYSVSVGEIIGSYRSLGKKVSFASIIKLSLESPIKASARRPEDYLSKVLGRLATSIDLGERLRGEDISVAFFINSLRETAMEILQTVDRKDIEGKRPCAVAASVVYSAEQVLATCESRKRLITQREIAECGDTAEYTIREQVARIFPSAVATVTTRKKQIHSRPKTR